MQRTPEQRFWSFVKKTDGCWFWLGGQDKDGYGVFGLSSQVKSVRANRFSYALHFEDPGEQHVLHTCDNPTCVRPDHLFTGTNADNVRDRDRKGRQVPGLRLHPEMAAKGVTHGMATLNEAAVKDIRQNYKPRKTPLRVFAKKYNISETNVSAIVRRVTWRHLPKEA